MKNVIFEEGVSTKSVLLVYQKAFYNAGCLMVNSLIQGGPSPAILADWCYDYIASKEVAPELQIDFKLRRKLSFIPNFCLLLILLFCLQKTYKIYLLCITK